jgi:hypothetical protein
MFEVAISKPDAARIGARVIYNLGEFAVVADGLNRADASKVSMGYQQQGADAAIWREDDYE